MPDDATISASDDDDDDDSESADSDAEGEEGESDDDESELDFDQSPVLTLSCAGCSMVVSERGMQVFLVADHSSLFSTDIPSPSVRQGGGRKIPTCDCTAVDIHCNGCQSIVGYHVLRPCALCGSADHNGHCTPTAIVERQLSCCFHQPCPVFVMSPHATG